MNGIANSKYCIIIASSRKWWWNGFKTSSSAHSKDWCYIEMTNLVKLNDTWTFHCSLVAFWYLVNYSSFHQKVFFFSQLKVINLK